VWQPPRRRTPAGSTPIPSPVRWLASAKDRDRRAEAPSWRESRIENRSAPSRDVLIPWPPVPGGYLFQSPLLTTSGGGGTSYTRPDACSTVGAPWTGHPWPGGLGSAPPCFGPPTPEPPACFFRLRRNGQADAGNPLARCRCPGACVDLSTLLPPAGAPGRRILEARLAENELLQSLSTWRNAAPRLALHAPRAPSFAAVASTAWSVTTPPHPLPDGCRLCRPAPGAVATLPLLAGDATGCPGPRCTARLTVAWVPPARTRNAIRRGVPWREALAGL